MVGIRFTMVAQVCSTVAGFCTKKVVSGSPMIFQSHKSPSSGPYTLPMHWVSITGPWKVSVVTTALMPMQFPFGMVIPMVSE